MGSDEQSSSSPDAIDLIRNPRRVPATSRDGLGRAKLVLPRRDRQAPTSPRPLWWIGGGLCPPETYRPSRSGPGSRRGWARGRGAAPSAQRALSVVVGFDFGEVDLAGALRALDGLRNAPHLVDDDRRSFGRRGSLHLGGGLLDDRRRRLDHAALGLGFPTSERAIQLFVRNHARQCISFL